MVFAPYEEIIDLDHLDTPRVLYSNCWASRDFVDNYQLLRNQGVDNPLIAERFGVRLASLKRRAEQHGCWRPDHKERVA